MEKIRNQAVELCREWETSAQRKNLIELIKQEVLPNERIEVQSALCLGLGSIGNAKLYPLPGYIKKSENTTTTSSVLESWEDDYSANDNYKSEDTEPVGQGHPRNHPLFQLIIFETVLDCLREKFTIDLVRFQDPKFTTADREFLVLRGYTVLPYGGNDDDKPKPCDPTLLELVSSSTFFFAPALDRPVVVEVMCAGKPSLYLGDDLLEDLAGPYLIYPGMETFPLTEAFEKFVLSCDFAGVKALGNADLGFMWPADLTDHDVMRKLQTRWLQAEQAKANWVVWQAERMKAKEAVISGNTITW